MMRLITCLLILTGTHLLAQEFVPLFDGEVPNMLPGMPPEETKPRDDGFGYVRNISKPGVQVFLPAGMHGVTAAVLIFPGGGYYLESYEAEGIRIAEVFSQHGVAAFVVKYRLPSDEYMQDKAIAPLQDAERAIQLVRSRASEWNVDPSRVGIMGFSAGGHLASTLGTHFNIPVVAGATPELSRPDFMILIYPVISMTDSLGHRGSRNLLLGEHPSDSLIHVFSNELQVTESTPPTFLMHAGDDQGVDVDNSIAFYEALRHHGVPAELHVYPHGGHGFVLHIDTEEWMRPIFDWLRRSGVQPVR